MTRPRKKARTKAKRPKPLLTTMGAWQIAYCHSDPFDDRTRFVALCAVELNAKDSGRLARWLQSKPVREWLAAQRDRRRGRK